MCAGYEPHSALPTAMPMVFCEHSPIIPPALRSVRVLATSAVRHLPRLCRGTYMCGVKEEPPALGKRAGRGWRQPSQRARPLGSYTMGSVAFSVADCGKPDTWQTRSGCNGLLCLAVGSVVASVGKQNAMHHHAPSCQPESDLKGTGNCPEGCYCPVVQHVWWRCGGLSTPGKPRTKLSPTLLTGCGSC